MLSFALWMTLAAVEWPTRGWKTSTPEAENVDAAVLEALGEEFDVDRPRLEGDLLAFLGELHDAGVVELREPPRAPGST